MKYIDGIKNDTKSLGWMGKWMNQIETSLVGLTIRPIKHIPIYEEITDETIIIYLKPVVIVTNKGGKTYLVYNTRGI